jgi:hypothetical protein
VELQGGKVADRSGGRSGFRWRALVAIAALTGAVALAGSAAPTGSADSAAVGVKITVVVPHSLLAWDSDCERGRRACVESQGLANVVVQRPDTEARALIANAPPGRHAFPASGDGATTVVASN